MGVVLQSRQEILGFGLLGASALPGSPWAGGVCRPSLLEDGAIASQPGSQLGRGQRGVKSRVVRDGLAHGEQQLAHVSRPSLVKLLLDKDEFAQKMGIAQTVLTVEVEIGGPAVMDEAAPEAGEDVEVLQGCCAAVAVDAVPGQQRGGEVVEPVERARHAQAGLVGMEHWGLLEPAHQVGLEIREGFVDELRRFLDGGLAEGMAKEVSGHLGDALQRNELLTTPVDQEADELGPVLRGSRHVGREGRADHVSGAWTALDLGLVLGDVKPQGRQIEHLPACQAEQGLPTKVTAAAAGAVDQPVGDDVVRACDGLEGMARMAGLATGRASTCDAQAFGGRLGVAIGCGRLGAVAAVEGQPRVEGFKTGLQITDLLCQVHDHVHQFGFGQAIEYVTGPHGRGVLASVGRGGRDRCP